MAAVGGRSGVTVMTVLAGSPRLPEVSVATADTWICAPGPPSAGTAWKLNWNGARVVAAKAPLRKKSTSSTSCCAPTSAATVAMPFSTTLPPFDAVRPAMTGGVRSVVPNV